MENVFDNKAVVTCGCGKTMSGLAMQSGTVYTWGKGEFEKPDSGKVIEWAHWNRSKKNLFIQDSMSDVYLMLGLGLDQCSETQDYLSSGRPMQLVRCYS